MKAGDNVILDVNPSFSTVNRVGWKCEVVELTDEHGERYLAVRDHLGVSWPLDESQVTLAPPDLGISISEDVATNEQLS